MRSSASILFGRYGFVWGAASMLVAGLAAGGLYLSLGSKNSLPTEKPRLGQERIAGPWGAIEALRLPMLNTTGRLPDQEQRFQEAAWHFPDISEEALRRFFDGTSHGGQKVILLDRQYWRPESNGWVISPPSRLISDLAPDTRAWIYTVLAKSGINYPQQHPFRFPLNGLEPCLAAAGLPKSTIAHLRRLSYTDGHSVCLADLETAREHLGAEEFERLVEVLYQNPAYRLRLAVAENQDIEPLARYWGKGGREDLIRPILKSVAFVPGGASLSLSSLLPPFARLRLYTFPVAWKNPAIEREDCFYTALNFFNTEPNTNFASQAVVEAVLRNEYAPISTDPTYGDRALVLDENNRIVHCAVYLAADFVFTKNGVASTQPWVVMKTADMLQAYRGRQGSARVIFLRPKEWMEAKAP